MKKILFLCIVINSYVSRAQLADGSIAPDFTLTDINGNVHHLYDYLNQGKTVYLDIFAAHCPTCWAYHNQQHLKNLNDMYGPSGSVTQEVVVLGIEHDPNNGTNEIYGISGNTQGNWDDGFPIINPEGTDRSQFITDYAATYYPMIYAICPNKIITLIGTVTTAELYAHVADCATIGIEETTDPETYIYYYDNRIYYNNLPQGARLEIIDTRGRMVYTANAATSGSCPADIFNPGLYIWTVRTDKLVITGKFMR